MADAVGFTCPSCGYDGQMPITEFVEVDWFVLECPGCEDSFEYRVMLFGEHHEVVQTLPWEEV